MAKHPSIGPNRPRRYRMRPEDEQRLHAIQIALNVATEADALRAAILIAHGATVKQGGALPAAKEPGQVSASVQSQGGQTGPAPPRVIPSAICPLCGATVPEAWIGTVHKTALKGLCKPVSA